MANGAFKFKDNSGNVVSFISGSGSDIVISGGTLNLSGMTGLTLGNVTMSGTTQNATSASHAASYLLTSSFNSYTGTTNTIIGSLQTSTGSLNSYTSSTNTRLGVIESTTSSLNTYTSSTNTRLGIIEGTTSSLNTFTSSANGRLNSIEGKTGSYATTGSNTFNGNLTVTGYIDAQELRTTYISSSILYRSGSTKFGDELTDTHAFTGSVLISGSITAANFSGSSSGTNTGDQTLAGLGGVGGSGTNGRVPKWTSSSALGDSVITDNGTNVRVANPFLADSRLAVGTNGGDQTYASVFVGGAITTGTAQYAFLSDPQLAGTDNYALFANARIKANTAVTNTFGVYIPSAEKLSGASIVNNYALYIANQTAGTTTNYSIYSSGGLNYLNGNTSIGTTQSTNAKLQVNSSSISSGGSGLWVYGFDGAANFYTTRGESVYNTALYLYNNPSEGQGYGTGISFRAKSDTTDSRAQGIIYTTWATATDASRTSNMVFGTTNAGVTGDKMWLTGSGRLGINQASPSGMLHVTSPNITASAPSLGWPVYNSEADTNARSIYIDTSGNSNTSTAGYGATVALILGQYYDSRAVITTVGSGGASPGDQGTGHGKDLLIKGGTSDNGIGYKGGRLYLNGGMGYGAGGYNANGGHVIMQSLTGSGNVGINTDNPTQKLHVSGYVRTNGISVFKTGGSVAGFIGHEQDWLGSGSSNNLICASEGGNDFKVFTNGTSAERITATSTGYVYLGKGWSASNHRINLEVAQGNNILVVSAYAGASNDSVLIKAASGANPNAAGTVMQVTTNSSTGRSISAGGTINASGNDYAEYMLKATTDTINKGDIVGVNIDGKLTNIFNEAISFVVKSTDPSYVGGDNWFNDEKRPSRTTDQTEEEFAPILADFESRLEIERSKVDRIAFSGQVPVNVTGATVGDYIIPIETEYGKITGQAITNPSFDQYKISVGKVWKIMEDGRAFIAVKIG